MSDPIKEIRKLMKENGFVYKTGGFVNPSGHMIYLSAVRPDGKTVSVAGYGKSAREAAEQLLAATKRMLEDAK